MFWPVGNACVVSQNVGSDIDLAIKILAMEYLLMTQ
jgi:hypothetical protein